MNRILLMLILCCCCGQARAQYVTNLTLLKNQFITGEPVVAVVTVTNRSGGDVIGGGHGARDWLQFEITSGVLHGLLKLKFPLPGHVQRGEKIRDQTQENWVVIRNNLGKVEVPQGSHQHLL